MRLIGMLDSPYVRRVAISLKMLGVNFSHESLSVFRNFDAFANINAIVKAPTFVTDDGIVLMDSGLIIEYAERIAGPGRSLVPADTHAHARSQRIIGVALAACEKAVQIVYENNLRPAEKRHQPWLDRVHGQMNAAFRLLDVEVRDAKPWRFGNRPLQADITAAVAHRFTREALPDAIAIGAYPALAALSARAEGTPEFLAFPTS